MIEKKLEINLKNNYLVMVAMFKQVLTNIKFISLRLKASNWVDGMKELKTAAVVIGKPYLFLLLDYQVNFLFIFFFKY